MPTPPRDRGSTPRRKPEGKREWLGKQQAPPGRGDVACQEERRSGGEVEAYVRSDRDRCRGHTAEESDDDAQGNLPRGPEGGDAAPHRGARRRPARPPR